MRICGCVGAAAGAREAGRVHHGLHGGDNRMTSAALTLMALRRTSCVLLVESMLLEMCRPAARGEAELVARREGPPVKGLPLVARPVPATLGSAPRGALDL